MLNLATYLHMQYIASYFYEKSEPVSVFEISGAISRVIVPKMANFLSKDLSNVPIYMHERQLHTGTELIALDREPEHERGRRQVVARVVARRDSVDHIIISREILIDS